MQFFSFGVGIAAQTIQSNKITSNLVFPFEIINIEINFKMFDDDAPPTKRLKINIPKKRRPNVRCANKSNNRAISVPQKMLPPQQDVRKRKMPQRRQANETVPNLSNLNQHILMEVLDYLPLEGKM